MLCPALSVGAKTPEHGTSRRGRGTPPLLPSPARPRTPGPSPAQQGPCRSRPGRASRARVPSSPPRPWTSRQLGRGLWPGHWRHWARAPLANRNGTKVRVGAEAPPSARGRPQPAARAAPHCPRGRGPEPHPLLLATGAPPSGGPQDDVGTEAGTGPACGDCRKPRRYSARPPEEPGFRWPRRRASTPEATNVTVPVPDAAGRTATSPGSPRGRRPNVRVCPRQGTSRWPRPARASILPLCSLSKITTDVRW